MLLKYKGQFFNITKSNINHKYVLYLITKCQSPNHLSEGIDKRNILSVY